MPKKTAAGPADDVGPDTTGEGSASPVTSRTRIEDMSTKNINGAVVADLTAFMPADSAVVEIMAVDGVRRTGWSIEMAGPSHPKTVAWGNEAARRSLRRQQQIETQQLNNRKIKPDDREPDDVRRENVEWVVSRIISWTPVMIDGETIEFSEEAAKKLFLRPEMAWAFSQLVEALANERSFSRPFATG